MRYQSAPGRFQRLGKVLRPGQVLGVSAKTHAGVCFFFNDAFGVAGAAVLRHDDFGFAAGLPQRAVQGLSEVIRPLVGGQQNAYERRHGSTCTFLRTQA